LSTHGPEQLLGVQVGQHALLFWPQLSTHGPEQLLGVQQVSLLRQTWLVAQLAQETMVPQVTMKVLHLPRQAELSGVQQVPASSSQMPELQLTVLFTPQLTGRWQLLSTSPHCLPAHVVATGSGTQPQTLLWQSAAPPSHSGQLIRFPQLSKVVSHRPVHQFGSCIHVQTFVTQDSPLGHGVLHVRICLQLSGPVPQWVSHQFGSGVHPTFPSSTSPPSVGRALSKSLSASNAGPPSAGGSTGASGTNAPSPAAVDASPRDVPLSIPSRDPHARGAHASRPTIPAVASRAKESQTPRAITSKITIRRFGTAMRRCLARSRIRALCGSCHDGHDLGVAQQVARTLRYLEDRRHQALRRLDSSLS
jgi:hypothetical protein